MESQKALAPPKPPAGPRRRWPASPPCPLAPEPAGRPARVSEPERVLLLAAGDLDGLAALLGADDPAVRAAGLDPVGAHADAGPVRPAVVQPTARRLALARRAVAKGRPWHGRNDVWFRPGPLLGRAGGKVAFVFPGLEAEFTPRTDDIAAHFGSAPGRRHRPDVRVGDIGRHGFGVVGVGRLLDQGAAPHGRRTDAVAGHSVGEWTAMAAAGLYAAADVDAFMAGFDPDSSPSPARLRRRRHLRRSAFRSGAGRTLGDSGIVLSHDNARPPVHGLSRSRPGRRGVRPRTARRGRALPGAALFRSGFHTLVARTVPRTHQAGRRRLPGSICPPCRCGPGRPRHPSLGRGGGPGTVRPAPAGARPVPRADRVALYAGHCVLVQTGPGRLPLLIGDTSATATTWPWPPTPAPPQRPGPAPAGWPPRCGRRGRPSRRAHRPGPGG
ncbi:hypothetical protein LT493_27190 [Streptomyces tricolor]|nr:hypothetical protein [Streptomyces tricolor]